MIKPIFKTSSGKISKSREYEIEKITDLLQDPTLREIEKFSLNIYLKSLLKDGKEQK